MTKTRSQLYSWYWNSTWLHLLRKKVGSHLLLSINKQNNRTQHHHKIILYSSFHIQRVLVVAKKLEQEKIRVGNKRLLVITVVLISRTFIQRTMICHRRGYLCLMHWMIQSSIYLSFFRFVNTCPAIYRKLLVITGALMARTETQRAIICHHWWYLCLLY